MKSIGQLINYKLRRFDVFQPLRVEQGLRKVGLKVFLFLLLGSLSACETTTLMELPEEKPQLVVGAVFNVDSLVKVDLSQSLSVNSSNSSFNPVENASIEIFKNAASLGFLDYKGKGKYLSKTKMPNEPGAEYSLKVMATGFESAQGTAVLPAAPVIENLVVKMNNTKNIWYKSFDVSFTLNDEAVDNYYFLRVYLVYKNGNKTTPFFELKNSLGQFSAAGRSYNELLLFDDGSFNGKSLTMDVVIPELYVPEFASHLLFEVGSITGNYYSYEREVKTQLNSSPFFSADKNPVSNNIQNGLGIFAPYNSSDMVYPLKN